MSLSASQRELRRKGIGMSELCRVVTDPWRVWYPKATGKSLFTGGPWGDWLEDAVAKDYVARRAQEGVNLRLLQAQDKDGSAITLRHPKHPWLLGTPDRCPVNDRCKVDAIDSVDTLRRLVDDGHMTAGLECKTNQAIVEKSADEADQWGSGLKAGESDLIQFLQDRCSDPQSVARDLMARYSLQSFVGAELASDDEDQWGPQGTVQMPRDYLIQCLGYADMAGANEWHLNRLRAGFGMFQTVLYRVGWVIDGINARDVFGWFVEQGERFMRDHMHPIEAPELWKPPQPRDTKTKFLELERLFPKDNGAMRPASTSDLLVLETFREATIALKRAEVYKDIVEAEVYARIGNDKGLDARGAGLGNVSWGQRAGRTTVDARQAIQALCERLSERIPAAELEALSQAAIEVATKQGEPYRQISRPAAWTKGIEEMVLAELAKQTAE